MKKLSLKNAESMLSRKEMKTINGGYGGYNGASCDAIAYITVTLVEEQREMDGLGCMSSEEYNAVYINAYNECLAGR